MRISCSHLAIPVFLMILMTGCGGDDGGNPTQPDPGGGTTTDDPLYEETSALIEQTAAVVEAALVTQDVAEALSLGAAVMLADTCVASVQVMNTDTDDPYLIAEFTNGIVFSMPVVHLDLIDDSPPESAFKDPVPRTYGGKSQLLPGNRNALFLDLPEFHTDVSTLAAVARDIGYHLDNVIIDPQVDDFSGLDSYGLVYIGTHGSNFDHNGRNYFGLLTHEKRTASRDSLYLQRHDFQDVAVRLQFCVYIEEDEQLGIADDTYYAVTDRFFEKYTGPMPDGSLVYIDACQSATRTSPTVIPPLADIMRSKGTGAYFGWDNFVHVATSKRAMNYLLANAMGNIPEGLQMVPTKTPPIRPHSVQDCFFSLQSKGWHIDQWSHYHAELLFMDFSEGSTEMVLRPSIGAIIVRTDPEEKTQELELLGDFTDEQGRVFVAETPAETMPGGIELTVKDWKNDMVLAYMQEGCNGYVVVEVNGRLSNPHPLTEWSSQFTVVGTQPGGIGPNINLEMNTRWRGEIVCERPMPEMDPFPMYGWTVPGLGLDSFCAYDYIGTFEYERFIYEYPEDLNRKTIYTHLTGSQMYYGTMTIKPAEGTVTIQLSFYQDAKALVTDKQNPEAPPEERNIPVTVGFWVDTTIDAEGTIAEGDVATPYAISWGQMQAESPPLETTGR